MRKLLLTIIAISAFALANDLPICEEFEGEKNISCVAGDNTALIITYHADKSRTYEFFKGDKKVYLEYGDKFVYASDGRRKIELDTIPNANKPAYIDELMFGLIESIDF